MTLEDEIAKLDLISSDAFEGGDANEFRQLAEWLRELKYIKTMTSVYEKIRKGNMKDGVIDAIDDHDILFNYFKQIKEVFEEVNADESNSNLGKE